MDTRALSFDDASAARLRALLDRTTRLLEHARNHQQDGEFEPAALDQAITNLADIRTMVLSGNSALDRDESDAPDTVASALTTLFDSMAPLAEQHGITMRSRVDVELESTPVGMLGPILEAALHDAVLSCSANGLTTRSVQVSASLEAGPVFRDIHIVIEDTGLRATDAATRSGVQILAESVHTVGGDIHMSSVPFETGTIVQVRVPLSALTHVVSDAMPPIDGAHAA